MADNYNNVLYSLLNVLSMRVAMTVKKRLDDVEQEKVSNKELRFFRYLVSMIRRLKTMEADKHNPPLFSNASAKLTQSLQSFFKKVRDVEETRTPQKDYEAVAAGVTTDKKVKRSDGGLDSTFDNIEDRSIASNFFTVNSRGSLLSMQHATPKILATSQIKDASVKK